LHEVVGNVKEVSRLGAGCFQPKPPPPAPLPPMTINTTTTTATTTTAITTRLLLLLLLLLLSLVLLGIVYFVVVVFLLLGRDCGSVGPIPTASAQSRPPPHGALLLVTPGLLGLLKEKKRKEKKRKLTKLKKCIERNQQQVHCQQLGNRKGCSFFCCFHYFFTNGMFIF
jgi:hypothetical protein